MTDPFVFVDRVWRLQPSDGDAYGFVSCKNWESGAWRDYPRKGRAQLKSLLEEINTDVYFSPCLFTATSRTAANALPSRVLYADLDSVAPDSLGDLCPTLGWETSPNRYQGLWVLDRALSVKQFEVLNKRLTYGTGADKGGWSVTKVLRVPGSISTKYGKSRSKRFTVAIVHRGERFTVQDLWGLLPKVEADKKARRLFGSAVSLPPRRQVMKKWRMKLPIRARKLISTKTVVAGDDRSRTLWELYALLLQAGMSAPEVLSVVRDTVWNKYAGQNREMQQLATEIEKAAAQHAEKGELERHRAALSNGRDKDTPRGATARRVEKRWRENPGMLKYMTEREFMMYTFPQPQWLVNGIWEQGAYGICAGQFKAFKTWILLDLCVSVSSGTNFLNNGRFPVQAPGKVLYLHEEGRSGAIQDRLHRIKSARGLAVPTTASRREIVMPVDLAIDIASHTNFKLTDETSQRELVTYLEREKPLLVVMESWYILAEEINENNAAEVAPVLDWLGKISRDFGCALVVSHHFNKTGMEEGGPKRRSLERMSGSGVFGRWFESAIFLTRTGEEVEHRFALETHHREQEGTDQTAMVMHIDRTLDDDYEVEILEDEDEVSAQKEVIDSIRAALENGNRVSTKQVDDWAKEMNIKSSSVKNQFGEYGLETKRGSRATGDNKTYVVRVSN